MPVTDQSPNVILMDSTETFLEVSGGVAVPNGTKGILLAGIQSNGSASYTLLDSSGRLTITGSVTVPNTVSITGSFSLSQTATVTGSVTVANTVTVTGSVGITNFPVTQSITGSVSLSQIATVTGSITVPNTVAVTGSVALSQIATVTGSITVPNTVTVTGSISVTNVPTVTGSITVANTPTVTGSISVTNVPTVTGSVSVLNTVSVTGSIAAVVTNPTLAGTGSASPTTGSLVGGKDTSSNFQPLAVTTGGFQFVTGSVSASIVGVPTVTGTITVGNVPTVTGSITVPNTVTITGSVGVNGQTFVSGGNLSVFISGSNLLTVTGSVSVLNTVNVTGSLKLSEALPSGSNNIGGVGITSDPAQGLTGSTAPARGVLTAGKDASGNLQAISTDVSGSVYNVPIDIGINLGRFQGTVGTMRGNITTSAAAEYALRQTTYTEQTSNAQRSFNSNNAADASAGTGARTVQLTYYTLSAGVVTGPFTETITLNGTTAVNTVATNIALVEKIEVITAGSGGTNTGIIQMFTTTAGGGSVFASIAATARQTNYAHHYIPTGRKCFLRNFTAYSTVSNANAPTFMVRTTDLATTNAAERIVMNTVQVQGSTITVYVEFTVPRMVTGPARVLIYHTTVNGTNQIGFAELDFFEL